MAAIEPLRNISTHFQEEAREESGASTGTPDSRTLRWTLFDTLFALGAVVYAFFFWKSVSPYWFHPHWTTDDALQQLFPFHAVHHPEIFRGDIIYELMKGYLAPAHYWLSYGITWLVGDPIMMGHWVMLIQAVLACGFLFGAVRHVAGNAPAFFAVAWLLHTRHVMQRLTAGLPRGWAAVIFAALLYFIVKRNHRGVLITLLLGCLLHPPATLLAAACYGIFLTWKVVLPSSRKDFVKPFISLALLSPLYILATYSVVHRPDDVGQMVTLEQAAQMPEFQKPKGRFPFVPLRDAEHEIRSFGFQAFIGRFYNPGRYWKRNMPEWVAGILLLLVLIGFARRRKLIPAELWSFLAATLVVYFLSREFAFKLYVPNRHLQFPMAFFLIPAFTIGFWKALFAGKPDIEEAGHVQYQTATTLKSSWASVLGLVALAGFVALGSGDGLNGAANFNYAFDKKGHVYQWMRDNTPEDALIAGHPTFIDAVQLFGMRRGFATTETAHPFYPEYYRKIKERLIISLRAHYATDFKELVDIVDPYGIDYVVFERKRFYPEALEQAEYFPPLNEMVQELTSHPWKDYVYRKLPKKMNLEKYPYMPFKDGQSAVVDIAALKKYLAEHADAAS